MTMKGLAENFRLKDLTDTLQGLRAKDLTESMPTREQIAQALGLATQRSRTTETFGGFGLFAMGILVGAGLALLFAPKSGDELREEIGERVTGLREGFSQQVDELSGGARPARTA